MTSESTAIQIHNGQSANNAQMAEYTGLKMVVSPAEAMQRVQELQAFVAQVMKKGVDYGVIPGTGDKPALLQPGAQKLAEIYGFAIDYEDAGSIEDFDRPLFVYKKKCILTSRRDGRFICAAVGSCNSKEDRYAWRWVGEKKLPDGIDRKLLKSRVGQYGKSYRLPNEDIFSLVNTIEKMACKRALVAAVISATRSSGVFTQDVEDLPPEVFGHADETRSWATNSSSASGSAQKVQEAEFEEQPNVSESVTRLLDLYAKASTSDEVASTLAEAKAKNEETPFTQPERAALSKARAQAERRVAEAAA